jgi:hypothetical protein
MESWMVMNLILIAVAPFAHSCADLMLIARVTETALLDTATQRPARAAWQLQVVQIQPKVRHI